VKQVLIVDQDNQVVKIKDK